MKAAIYLILILTLPLASCRSAKKEKTQYKASQQTEVKNDIAISEGARLDTSLDEALRRAIAERLRISIRQTVYDTDKPIDEATGRRPVLAETDIQLAKDTDTAEATDSHSEATASSTKQTKDASQKSEKMKAEAKHETEKKPDDWRSLLICFGGLTALCIVFLKYFKKMF